MKKEAVRRCFYAFLIICADVGIGSEMLLFGMESCSPKCRGSLLTEKLPQCVVSSIKDSSISNFLCSSSSGKYVRNGLFRGYNPRNFELVKQQCSRFFDEKTMLEWLAGFCRVHIVLSRRNQDLFDQIRVSNISHPMETVLQPRMSIIFGLGKIFGVELDSDTVIKASLLSSIRLPWDSIINLFRQLFENGVFHKYTFEESLFVLCVSPEEPSIFLRWFDKDKYKNDKIFYVNCLAGAIKEWLKVSMGVTWTTVDDVRRGSLSATNILLKYLDTVCEQTHEKTE
jgi:hypothetical protein